MYKMMGAANDELSKCPWMRGFLFFLFFLAVMVHSAAAHDGKGNGARPLRQEISVTLHPESHRLHGETVVVFPAGAGQVELHLANSATVEEVTVAGRPTVAPFRDGLIVLELSPYSGSGTVTVRWRGEYNDRVAEQSGSEDPSYGVSAAITPRGTFLGSGTHWYPSPSRTPVVRSLRVEAPAGTEAISFGRRMLRETRDGVSRSLWVEDHPAGELSLSAGPYLVAESRVGEIPLYSYLYRENAALSSRYLDAAARYIDFYSEILGPYPFEKFAVVENFFPTGYGFPSYTLLGSTVIRLPFIVDTSYPHEIAHCWWGNGVEPDLRQGNWSEALVTYLADYLLKEKKSPDAAREHRLQLVRDFSTLVTPERDFPLSSFVGRVDPASRAIGYGKGAMVFHMIRQKIGDQAFFGALRDLAAQRMYSSAGWDDLVQAFSKRARLDLAPLVTPWLTRTGGPRLKLADVDRRQGAGGGWIVSGSILQSPPLYRLQVPLLVETAEGGREVRRQVPVQGGRADFHISVPNRPLSVQLDPDGDLFRLLSPGELPATVNSLKGAPKVVAVVTRTCRASEAQLKQLLRSLEKGDATVIGEEKLDQSLLAVADLLFCGVPEGKLLPPLPGEITVSSQSFTIGGNRFSEDDLLFLVAERPGAQGRVAGLFLPLSRRAAEQYLSKITHYGKYSYLVFSGGGNRFKGTFDAPSGPAMVVFEREEYK